MATSRTPRAQHERALDDLLSAVIDGARRAATVRERLSDLDSWNGVDENKFTQNLDVVDAWEALDDIDRAYRTLRRIAERWGAQ